MSSLYLMFPMNYIAVGAMLGILCQSIDVTFGIVMATVVVGLAREM